MIENSPETASVMAEFKPDKMEYDPGLQSVHTEVPADRDKIGVRVTETSIGGIQNPTLSSSLEIGILLSFHTDIPCALCQS
jgi:hypothetical protein